MSAVHDGAVVAELVAAGILAVARRPARVHRAPNPCSVRRSVQRGAHDRPAEPARGAAQLILAGGALALLWGATDRALLRWSRLAFAVFALAAITGFGHLAH